MNLGRWLAKILAKTRGLWLISLGWLLAGQVVQPVRAAPGAQEPAVEPAERQARKFTDPYAAYQAGAYPEALPQFIEQQINDPHNPQLLYNIGNVHYQMHDYQAAEQAYQQALLAGEPTLASKLWYNLGNVAYMAGKLETAVERYQKALELNPRDEDAKYNLEFTREEIKKRLAEAEKRAAAKPPPSSCKNPAAGGKDKEPAANKPEARKEPEQDQGAEKPQQDQANAPKESAAKSREAAKETPQEEPKKAAGAQKEAGKAGSAKVAGAGSGSLTPEEMERYLQGLDEVRLEKGEPSGEVPIFPGAARRGGKDW